MEAMCPICLGKKTDCEECRGTGTVDVNLAEGDIYTQYCKDCGETNGGCIVGPDSPLKVPPPDRECVFCKSGHAKYIPAENVIAIDVVKRCIKLAENTASRFFCRPGGDAHYIITELQASVSRLESGSAIEDIDSARGGEN